MKEIEELEKLVDKLIEGYKKMKSENERLWEELNSAVERVERLEREKKELELILESHRKSLNTLVTKLQKFLSMTTGQELVWDEEEGEHQTG
ncbi:MAG: hypothetical protein B5M49_04610 [Thermotoga sp. 4484_232]|nr:MAG: hypothetical protein B5M49_04610 [Thermotoga sp. 4484_232]RKX57289.1 MAG: hypothetical protein DRP24_00800 [Thermotoga sp.]HDG61730.1 hypothetical protein [Thermotoga sp.]